jgi:hypothetical protein
LHASAFAFRAPLLLLLKQKHPCKAAVREFESQLVPQLVFHFIGVVERLGEPANQDGLLRLP